MKGNEIKRLFCKPPKAHLNNLFFQNGFIARKFFDYPDDAMRVKQISI